MPDSDSLLVMRNMTISPLQSIGRAVPLLLVAGCLALPEIAVAADGADNFKAFVGARIIDGTGKPAMEKATILVKNGRIAAVGQSVKVPAGAQQIDVSGKTIIPGLINAHGHVNEMSQLGLYARYGVTILALVVALFILHVWLPAGRRRFLQILPGILFTMVASLISGIVFGQYLARFASNYVTMYAGLASVIIALVFLYFIAAIFVYGGELNAAIIKSRLPHGVSLQAAQSLDRAETRA